MSEEDPQTKPEPDEPPMAKIAPPHDESEEQAADQQPVLDYASPREPVKLVTVCTFSAASQAQLTAGMLENEGVSAVVFDENVGTLGWVSPIPVQIKVPQDQEQLARELIAKWEQTRRDRYRAAEAVCPKCQSKNVGGPPFTWGYTLYVILLCGIPLLYRHASRVCYDCGHRWQYDDVIEDDDDRDDRDSDDGDDDAE